MRSGHALPALPTPSKRPTHQGCALGAASSPGGLWSEFNIVLHGCSDGLLDFWAHGSKGVLVGSLPAFCSEKTNGPLTRNAIFLFAFLRYATLLRQYRRCEPHS